MSAYEDYDAPTCWADCSAEEIGEAVASGILCSECGVEFVLAHQRKTACGYCWPRLSLAEQRVTAKATHPEVNREAFRQRAKQRKESK